MFSTKPTAKTFKIARIAGLALLAFLLLARSFDPVLTPNLGNKSLDLLQRLWPRPDAPASVVVVDIDENSLDEYGQWPWPRTRIADLLEILSNHGAIAVGFDIVFAGNDRLSPPHIAQDNPDLPDDVISALSRLPQNEDRMALAMKTVSTVLAESSAGQRNAERLEATHSPGVELRRIPFTRLGDDPLPHLYRFPRLVQNVKPLTDAASGVGIITLVPDPDGTIRKIPLVVEVAGVKRLALSAEMLRVATGGDAFATKTDDAGIRSVVVGGIEVSTGPNAVIRPWFNQFKSDRYISAGQVLSGRVDRKDIAGKMVLVSASANERRDYHATPVASQMPGVEIHAQVIENILTRQFLVRPGYAPAVEFVFLLGAGLLIIWIVPKLGALRSGAAALVIVTAFSMGSIWAFYAGKLLIDTVFPSVAVVLILVLMTMANFFREKFGKWQIQNAFGPYLSPALVDQLAGDPQMLVLGGETKKLTSLFVDIRGFDRFYESCKDNPQALTRMMNRFLNTLSAPILEEEGTLDTYSGSAIIAFWNAPLTTEYHELRACKAALKMTGHLEELNRARREECMVSDDEPWQEFNIGIGINTGESVVANMGSDFRFDYTARGDAVDLAPFLERQSKPYGLPIVLGDQTARAVEKTLAVFEVDLIRVNGKSEPERIHVLIGDEALRESEDFMALRAMNAMMLSAYRNRNWSDAYRALDELGEIADRMGMEDLLSEYLFIYETRITEFKVNPPGNRWDGVFTILQE